MSSNKVKGLLKGLRYISQMFENEKEQEIQIGYPTDVKHVAHIGWDGPSVNSPSWMNEFQTSPGFASAPLGLTGDVQNKGQDNSVKWVSEDSRRRSSRYVNSQGQGTDLPDLPKASRRQLMDNTTDSPTREKSRQSRKSSNKNSQPKYSSDGSILTQQGDGSPAHNLSDNPKKTRRKKSKENSSSGGGSSKTRSKARSPDPSIEFGSPLKSQSKSRNKERSFEENEQYERELSRIP